MRGVPPSAFGRIVGALPPPALCAVLMDEAEVRPVACGLAVADGHLVGLFDLLVAKDVRRRGYGAQLLRRLVSWGIDRGATQAYLQVQGDNAPASNLYRKLGFQSAYQYWYRVRAP
jgi:ribosomal protein S18 acetylase RimI-like enzyme